MDRNKPKYRCSCCDTLVSINNYVSRRWAANDDVDVAICHECNANIRESGYTFVRDFLNHPLTVNRRKAKS